MQVSNFDAREAILRSIREHLAASAPHDFVRGEGQEADGRGQTEGERLSRVKTEMLPQDNGRLTFATLAGEPVAPPSLLEIFRENLEAVGGHCMVASSEAEVVAALNSIVAGLQPTPLRARRIALSNAPLIQRLAQQITATTEEIAVTPSSADLFEYDLGITTAQAAIAETGTLVLDSECERHRLVSLVPPVHVAIVQASTIVLTLGEALAEVHRKEGVALSPTITLITGPSRTADIELTLAIGVHGPQELFVIVNEGK
jgi:L-lactate dehydrogenase complex protein LldG